MQFKLFVYQPLFQGCDVIASHFPAYNKERDRGRCLLPSKASRRSEASFNIGFDNFTSELGSSFPVFVIANAIKSFVKIFRPLKLCLNIATTKRSHCKFWFPYFLIVYHFLFTNLLAVSQYSGQKVLLFSQMPLTSHRWAGSVEKSSHIQHSVNQYRASKVSIKNIKMFKWNTNKIIK